MLLFRHVMLTGLPIARGTCLSLATVLLQYLVLALAGEGKLTLHSRLDGPLLELGLFRIWTLHTL
jgi:hypothetical protein